MTPTAVPPSSPSLCDALLRRLTPEQAAGIEAAPCDESTFAQARRIVDEVRDGGEPALRRYGERFGEIEPGAPLVIGRERLRRAVERIPRADRELLERTAERIASFARLQRAACAPVRAVASGVECGHEFIPVERAGCYAPAGRYPLPSTVLMTAITARAAGVGLVCVASPRPGPLMLAAAAVAGADMLTTVGGAHGIAAMAFGVASIPACDVVCGPGNRWVTAAKHAVSTRVRIDMLAGPSELLVLADDSADPETVAADLLAQAEHDDDAVPMLVTTSEALAGGVESALRRQLETLPSAVTARRALANGFACVCSGLAEALRVSDARGPEHLEVITRDPEAVAASVRHAGAIFIGAGAAEVLGDYGVGPNHTLPTGGTARSRAGLSVLDFLRARTFVRVIDPAAAGAVAQDAAALARLEHLEGHARAAERRAGAAARG